MTIRKRIISLTLLIVMVLTIGGEIFSAFVIKASAEGAVSHSNVLDDLERDESFNPEDYPADANDYSLQVIQVAEGSNGELFVYVYQPSAKYNPVYATSISFNTGREELKFLNYTLTFLNSNSTLQKYKVDGYNVSSDAERRYEITTIYRKPVNDSEATEDAGNLIAEVPFKVGKRYTFTDGANGSQNLVVEDLDVITVTDKHVGFMRYPASYMLAENEVDCHYVAFSTNKKIEQLLEADVFYTKQKYENHITGSRIEYLEKTPGYSYLKFGESIVYDSDRWFSIDYKWNTIEPVADFLKNEVNYEIYSGSVFDASIGSIINEDVEAKLSELDWVIRFEITDFFTNLSQSTGQILTTFGTIIGDVSIMRLAFETDGIYYNLGVVDSKQSGSLYPDNITKSELTLTEEVIVLLSLILLVVVVIALWKPVCAIVKMFWNLLKWIFNLILSIIAFPFRLIRWIFGK